MRQYFRISFIFSVLLLFIGINVSGGNAINSNSPDKSVLSIPAIHHGGEFSSERLPHSITFQIRHRSAEENECVVLSPNFGVVIEVTCPDSPPEYLSKWNTYFHITQEDLPNDQAIPSSFSLRAPPFSC